jgi:CBS domain-containing protein
MSKLVREAMTPDPQTVDKTTNVVDAARLMKEHDVGSLPVVEQDEMAGGYIVNRLVGIVTDRDIAIRVAGEGLDPNTVRVEEIYSEQPATAVPDEPVDDALERMAELQVRRLPVVDEDRLIGMLAQADVAHVAKDKKVAHLVEAISEPANG